MGPLEDVFFVARTFLSAGTSNPLQRRLLLFGEFLFQMAFEFRNGGERFVAFEASQREVK